MASYLTPIFWALGILVASYLLSFVSYNIGYSDTALQTELKAEGYIEWYEDIISLDKLPEKVTNEVIEETILSLCQEPNYPCKEVKKGYEAYKEIKGLKDSADDIADIYFFINK